MGGEYRSKIIEALTEAELEEKYYAFVGECLYDYGHRGYTGSFAEKPEVEVIPSTIGLNICSECGSATVDVWTKHDAREHCINENDKWGPAYAYDIGEGKYYIGGWCSS